MAKDEAVEVAGVKIQELTLEQIGSLGVALATELDRREEENNAKAQDLTDKRNEMAEKLGLTVTHEDVPAAPTGKKRGPKVGSKRGPKPGGGGGKRGKWTLQTGVSEVLRRHGAMGKNDIAKALVKELKYEHSCKTGKTGDWVADNKSFINSVYVTGIGKNTGVTKTTDGYDLTAAGRKEAEAHAKG